MSIRFYCPECRQALHVADRQAGTSVRCARCHQTVQVPGPAQQAAVPLPVGESPEIPYRRETPRSRGANDHVRVHRRIVYAQGLLLVAVGIVCFACGFLAGRQRSPAEGQRETGGPHMFVGQVGYYDRHGGWAPDEGSLLLALPENQQADERVSAADLGVGRPLPSAVHPALATLEVLGGAYGRADESGRFRLRLPHAGSYYLVCISHHAERHEAESPENATLALLGRFFSDPVELLGDQQSTTLQEEVAGPTEVEVTFRAESLRE